MNVLLFHCQLFRGQGTVHSRLKDFQIGLAETDVRPLICFCRHHNPRKKATAETETGKSKIISEKKPLFI